MHIVLPLGILTNNEANGEIRKHCRLVKGILVVLLVKVRKYPMVLTSVAISVKLIMLLEFLSTSCA